MDAKAESLPDNPNGQTSTTVAFNAPVVAEHSLYTTNGGFPQQKLQTFDDCYQSATPPTTANPNGIPFTKGNCDGAIDLGDLSGAVQRQFDSRQTQRIRELRLDAGWDATDNLHLSAGGNWHETKTRQTQYNTRQVLGDWGNSLPPEIQAVAPDQVFNFCLVCKFDHHSADADLAREVEDIADADRVRERQRLTIVGRRSDMLDGGAGWSGIGCGGHHQGSGCDYEK